VDKSFISVVKSVEYVSGRMSDITLRGGWCPVINLNVHVPIVAPMGEKSNTYVIGRKERRKETARKTKT
jgi:hypothetical protein